MEECLEFCEGYLRDVENFEEGTLKGWMLGKIVLGGEYIIKTKQDLLIMNDDLFECLFVE